MEIKNKKRIIFLLSHPIQYFSPLFQQMAKEESIDLLVLYCSDENVKGHIDKGFGVEVKWDIPLLEGYNYKSLKNNSWKPSIFNGFFGLVNLEIFKVLKNERGSYLVIHGWAYATNFIAVIAAKLSGVKLCLRAENPLSQELLKSRHMLFLRKIFFKYIFYPLFDYFFYIGSQNKKLVPNSFRELKEKDKNIGMVVGAKRQQNRWPIEYFKEVSDYLLQKGFNILLFGGPDDTERANQITGEKVFNFCGKLTPLETAEMMKYCKLVISNDTGPMHLAYAVGIPLIAIFSSRDYAGKWFPPEGNFTFRDKNIVCVDCLNACEKDNKCLRGIKPAQIIATFDEMIKHLNA